MDAQTLLDNFSTVTDAPGGVQRLRDLVLDLAVSGRLVEQDQHEEPATELLTRIKSDQERLLAAGSTKANRPHSPRPTDPRPLPDGWCWTYMPRLGFVNPRNVADPRVVAGFVPMPLIPTDTRETPGFESRNWSEISNGYTHIADGDVAVAKITPCFQNGKSAVFTGLPAGIGAATTELFVLRPTPGGVVSRYIHIVVRSPSFIRNGVPEMTGTAGQQRLPRQYFTDTPIPLPPLAEQGRIVARVDELMALCDQLEARQAQRSRATTRFRGSALHSLTEAETTDDLRYAWERVGTYWRVLTSAPGCTEELRRSVLQLLVAGRLVPQVGSDEPSDGLVQRAREDRETFIGRRLTRIVKDDPTYERSEPLPNGWSWAPLQDLVRFIDYRGRTPAKTESGMPLVTAKNIRRGFVSETPREYIAEADFDAWMSRGLPRVGDVLFTTEAPMGNAAMIRTATRFALAQRTITLAPYADFSGAFLELLLLSPWFGSELAKRATGMTATGIKASKLRLIRIPVPPQPEQDRIVAVAGHLLRQAGDLSRMLQRESDSGEAVSVGLARIQLDDLQPGMVSSTTTSEPECR